MAFNTTKHIYLERRLCIIPCYFDT